jgi:drug/metabolite transporter (DMT)-like permease
MARRNSLLALLAGTLACAAAYASAFLPGDPPAWSPWALGIGTAVVMVAASALGAARADTGIGRLKLPFAIVFLIVAGGFVAALLMQTPGDNPRLFLGLPAGAAIVLLGIGILPLLVLPIAYALTFEDMTLSEADLARVREAARAWQAKQQGVATQPIHAEAPEPAEVVA